MIKIETLLEKIEKIPDKSGVYIFRDSKKVPIYVGKAVNLRKRLLQYFRESPFLKANAIVSHSKWIDFRPTDSEVEALILEADLIRHFRPKFNVREKDDKSFLYLVIRDDDFPYLEFIREKNLILKAGDKAFGPFLESNSTKEAIKIIRKIFPFRDCKKFLFEKSKKEKRPCLYFYLGKCPAPCVGKITKSDYKKLIKEVELFLKNKKEKLIKKLEEEMRQAASRKEFEKASLIRDRLKFLNKLNRFHFIEDSLFSAREKIRIEIFDIAQIFGESKAGGMVVFKGEISPLNIISGNFVKDEFRRFKLKKGKDDLSLLKEMLERRFKHSEWESPQLVLVDGGEEQVRIAREVLKRIHLDIPVLGITKGKNHKAKKPTFPFDRFKWPKLVDLVRKNWLLFVKLDEKAHQFAQSYFHILRKKKLHT